MTVLVAAIIGAVALFGIEAARLTLTDLASLETQDAAQRAAEAAAGRAADLIVAGLSTDAQIDAAAQSEAAAIAGANVMRGSVQTITVVRTSSATELVRIDLSLSSSYGGFIGPRQLSASGAAAVRQ